MAEFAACNAGTKIELADSYAVVFDVVGEVIVALCHGTNEDCYAFALVEPRDVVTYTYNLCVEAECDLATVRWEVVGNRILDHLDELLLGVDGPNLVLVQKLNHQTSESLERTRDADSRADSYEHILGGLNVDLELARFVDWRIEESEQAL